MRGSSLGVKGGERRLGVGLGAAQGEALEGLGAEAEFAADQAVRPGGLVPPGTEQKPCRCGCPARIFAVACFTP